MRLILGGPGTGKTTRLLDIVSQEIANGTPPDRIAFVSFTRKAAQEAQERASKKFNLSASDLPFFRTMHSMTHKYGGTTDKSIMSQSNWSEFSELVGFKVTKGKALGDDFTTSGDTGAKSMQVIGYAHATGMSLEDAYHAVGDGIEWYTLKYIADSYEAYKRDTHRVDFNDMLDRYIAHGAPLNVDTVIIDEAQDLSGALWRVADHMFSHCKNIIVAGDDMQSIFRWAGADVNRFLSLTDTPEVLPVSHRLPPEVFNLADEIASRVEHKYEKHWRPADHEGSVNLVSRLEEYDYANGSWMILARNAYLLDDFKKQVRHEGYAYTTQGKSSVDEDESRAIRMYERLRKGGEVDAGQLKFISEFMGHNRLQKLPGGSRMYTARDVHDDHGFDIGGTPWFDALLTIGDEQRQYYQAILRNGGKLTDDPRIYIGTIHSVKGGEADNVIIRPDVSPKTMRNMDRNPDDEHRVFYTGITRTKKNLYVVDYASPSYYHII